MHTYIHTPPPSHARLCMARTFFFCWAALFSFSLFADVGYVKVVCALSCCLCCVFMCILLRNSTSAVSSTTVVALWLLQVNERSSETERCICGRRSSSESERGSTDCERCKVNWRRPGILIPIVHSAYAFTLFVFLSISF
jgi:hypothetical protein